MAELTLFHFREGDSPLHRYDARHKLPVLIVLATAIFRVAPAGLLVLSLLVAAALLTARLPLSVIARELRGFAVLLLLMFAAQSFLATRGSIELGGLVVWRLLLAVVLGALFSATTMLSQIRAAVAWYLRPFPFIPGGRAATMIELTVSLIPLIFDTERTIAEAHQSRCIQNARRPLRRLRALAVPLLLMTFARADATAQAMEARCYTDARTLPSLSGRPVDWAITAPITAGVVALLIWLHT